jgi:NUDIX domain.
MLVQDQPDLHVFLCQRNVDSVWIAGASVFPGGAIDPDDRHPDWEARSSGWDDRRASAALGIDRGGLGFWVGAIRETFEEAGVLLARGRDGTPVDASAPIFVEARNALNAGELDFRTFVTTHDLVLSADALHLFSHWITPEGSPRRYDTWFFVGAAPAGAYEHDNAELVASIWLRPVDALDAAERGDLDLIFPTRKSLEVLAGYDRSADLLAAAREGALPCPT